MVNRLQEENRRFKQNDTKNVNIVDDENHVPKIEQNASNLLNESDYQKVKRLRGQMEQQRDELMCRDQEIEEKNTEIENVRVCFIQNLNISTTSNYIFNHLNSFLQCSIQLERLRTTGRESRKRQKLLQTQVQKLLGERSDLLVQIQDQKREINVLRRSLGFGGDDEKFDLKTASTGAGSNLSKDDLKPILMERDSLKHKIKELENELKQFKPTVMDDIKSDTIAEEKTPEKIP